MNEKELKEALDNIEIEDYLGILKLGKRLMNTIKAFKQEKSIKIAVLGSCSIQHLISALRVYLLKYDIQADIYQGEYNGIEMDALSDGSDLYKFNPQIVLIMTYYKDIKIIPDLFAGDNDIELHLKREESRYRNLWNHINEKCQCHIFQTNFVLPSLRTLGNLEYKYKFSKNTYIQKINLHLLDSKPNNVDFIDLDFIASYVGKGKWFDNVAYFMSKQAFSLEVIGFVADTIAKMIAAHKGLVRKCLVLDLDNTLWGGIVGDLGFEGINLDPNDPIGEAYLNFQQYVLDLKNRGVILAVCSKNDLDIAKEPFIENKKMILSLDDISCFIANWDDKSSNLRQIASELNIGIDSLVFFDDNPAEREIVKRFLPEVWVVNVPEDPANYASVLAFENPFEWSYITKEDISRSQSYIQNKKRITSNLSFNDYNEYLQDLEMQAFIKYIDNDDSTRFLQLINKTNQFNLRTQRYNELQIEQFSNDKNYSLISISISDKFSEYGIVSCIILRKEKRICFIDTWVMSCRVLKRGIESLVMEKIIESATEMGCDQVVGEYIPTVKNAMVKNIYIDFGFEPVDFLEKTNCSSSEGNLYLLKDLNKIKQNPYYISKN
ncbi:MAG TPA: HAD-IIIC family phosphatase [Clostridiales bacterium]|nr:HAD-IIIC family phosphatase [Clostridiales bacterium]